MAKVISYDSSGILLEWKESMYQLIKAKAKSRGIKVDRSKVERYLDKRIQDHIVNPRVTAVNNYTNQTTRTDLLTLLDLIEKNRLVIGGGGCLFVQHGMKPNLLLDFIKYVMEQRTFWKKERKKYEVDTYEYAYADLNQLLNKLIDF